MNKKMKMIAAAAAAVLTLAACGSDSDSVDTTMAPDTTMAAEAPGTIVEVAQANPDFSTLVAAVTAAGLGETLSGEGPFTVFAPTNAAFEALPAGVLEALLLPENKDTLVKILTYHVVPGAVMAADVTDGHVATVEGQNVTLSTADGVTVDGAKVVTTDIAASNGTIHVIDTVILPKG